MVDLAANSISDAVHVNLSLANLRNSLRILSENFFFPPKIIPYELTKLTLLFKNYFMGKGKIKIILCINRNECDETIVSWCFIFTFH